jgi:probable F420-dependent oxidoreductase
MSQIRIGVQVQPQHATYANMRRTWAELDALGADIIFTWDHFFPLQGDPDGLHFESLALQAAMAEVTERAQIGALVMCNSYRNPQYLADALRTIDHISGGRLIAGLGAGWFERDYDEYGYEFGTAPGRLRALADALPVIRDRLGKLTPGPVGELPILIGGGGEKVTLRITAQHADAWNGFGSPTEWGRKNQILTDWCNKLGRDPAQIERTCSIGSEDIGKADEYLKAGAQQIVCRLRPPHDWKEIEPLVAWRDRVRAGS